MNEQPKRIAFADYRFWSVMTLVFLVCLQIYIWYDNQARIAWFENSILEIMDRQKNEIINVTHQRDEYKSNANVLAGRVIELQNRLITQKEGFLPLPEQMDYLELVLNDVKNQLGIPSGPKEPK